MFKYCLAKLQFIIQQKRLFIIKVPESHNIFGVTQ